MNSWAVLPQQPKVGSRTSKLYALALVMCWLQLTVCGVACSCAVCWTRFVVGAMRRRS